jgi:hypothetical protein
MLPLEESFKLFQHYYQSHFLMYPPPFFYPPYFNFTHQDSLPAHRQTNNPSQLYNAKEILLTASEASA